MQPSKKETLLVGICGPSGAGKSTLVRAIQKKEPRIGHLELDRFYRERRFVERLDYSFDNPNAIAWDELLAAVQSLKEGATPNVPVYSKAIHARTGSEPFGRSPVIVVEGHALFWHPRMQGGELLDLRLWVEASEDTRRARRVRRDREELQRPADESTEQWFKDVQPAQDAHLQSTKRFADIIVVNELDDAQGPGLGAATVILDSIRQHPRSVLS